MKAETSYLDKLRFDPTLTRSTVAKYIANPRLVLLIVSLIIGLGIFSYLNIARVLNPKINIPIILITTVLPGAGPADVESLVTVPIESAVTGVQRVKTVQSSSRDSVSIINIEFESGVDPDKARTDIQSAVDSVNDLPEDAQAPKVVKLDFENQPVWVFDLISNGDSASLIRFARQLNKHIEDLPSVDRVETTGLEDQEIQIVLKPEVISSNKLNPMQISQAVKTALSSFPAGMVNTGVSTFTLSIDPAVSTVQDIRDLRVTLNGSTVSLSDIAEIYERSKPEQSEAYYARANEDPKRAVTFRVYRTGTTNIDKAVADTEKELEDIMKPYEDRFSIATIVNYADMIDEQFRDLLRDFWLTITLIFVSLFIFLGTRQAIVASLATPLSFLITFIIMKVTGIDISFIALFSLLLALGLLIDDTIVVISAMTGYYRSGKFTPFETGLLVWRDFGVAILTTTITTVWAFLPLLLSTGIIGEFIKPIPIVVSSALMASLFVAMLITLPFIIIILKPSLPRRVIIFFRILVVLIALGLFIALAPKTNIFPVMLLIFLALIYLAYKMIVVLTHKTVTASKSERHSHRFRRLSGILENGIISFERVSNVYKKFIRRILLSPSARIKTIAMVIIFSIFSYLLLPLGFVKNEFFPKTDEDYIFLNLEMPSGTNLQTTKNEIVTIAREIRSLTNLDYLTIDLGSTSGGFMGTGGNNIASITLKLKENRNKTSVAIAQDLRRQFANYQTGRLSVEEQSGGPPAGSDIQIKLFGEDLTVLDNYATTVQKYLETQAGVTNIDKTIKPGTSKIVFEPDKQKLADNGLSPDVVGLWMRMFASGMKVDDLKTEGETQDITLRLNPDTQVPERIRQLVLPGPRGDIPIANLGDLKLKSNPTLITREGGKRTISVTASVTPGYSITTLNRDLERYAEGQLKLPAGYSWTTGGVNEENQRSVNSIFQAMALSFFLILVTMVVQFSSFRRALIVLLVIPLSIAGVFIIFALANIPLSFPALIGVLALFGIVVKNSILIVDKIVQNINAGLDYIDAIVDGASSRLEAIALTSMTAILGLIPVTLSNALWQGLGGAIIAGLTFSGTIMLFFIPLVYYYWFRPSDIHNRQLKK